VSRTKRTNKTAAAKRRRVSQSVPKLCGADIEQANFIEGWDHPHGTARFACRALLREVAGVGDDRTDNADRTGSSDGAIAMTGATSDVAGQELLEFYQNDGGAGISDNSYRNGHGYGNPYGGGYGYSDYHSYGYGGSYSGYGGVYGYNPQDHGRKYLPANGGCAYEDLSHLELAMPEVLSAYDHVAAWHAMLRIAREAMVRANAGLAEGQRIQVLVNNSDGRGNSYGSHLNFLLTRRCWDNIFSRRLHYMLYLAAYQISSILFTGAGKVGSEHGRPDAPYQISQRADFFEVLMGIHTTHNRSIVNSRNESLCGRSSAYGGGSAADKRLARLHVIFYDNTLCHVASLLKVGAMQLVLAMIEREDVRTDLILDDPLKALLRFSRDLNLTRTARMASKARYSMIDIQSEILEGAHRFVAQGKAEGIVPRAREILDTWTGVVEQFRRRDLAALAGKVDWVLKKSILKRAVSRNQLAWDSPQIKHLDHLYSSLDPNQGLFWAYDRAGAVEHVVCDGRIERFVHEPPADTRAWLRAEILRRVDPDEVVSVNWDEIRLKFPRKRDGMWPIHDYYTLEMHNPLGFTREACEEILAASQGLKEAVIALGGYEGTCRSKGSESHDGGEIVLSSQGWAGNAMKYRSQDRRHPNR